VSNLLTSLIRRTPELEDGADSTPKHLGWLMLTALGIGATIGAGIFVMPGRIAEKAGPAGILSFVITGAIFLFVGVCYERFAAKVPHGVSAYSYVYRSIGEIFAWIVAFGLFLEYSFGASAVAIGWSQYLKKSLDPTPYAYHLPSMLTGPSMDASGFHFGINIVALAVVAVVTTILLVGGVTKSAKLNFVLVCLKCTLLALFMAAGIHHFHPANWQPFMPKGWDGVWKGAAIAVFPYVGFDALYTFARESKSIKDTRLATYLCIGLVAFLYVAVMAIATAIEPVFPGGDISHINPHFKGSEASAPLAVLLMANGDTWVGQLIAVGAVIGIFNVLLVLSMGGPRIFRNMAEDGLLPKIFTRVHKGNPTIGVILNGLVVGGMAGFVPFETVTDIMVLGTLIAFIFVCLGAMRMRIVHPLVSILGIVGCSFLIYNLDPLVLKVYCITCPVGLVIYFSYGYWHSKLRNGGNKPVPVEQGVSH
jgi:APA family basic amino acid/polyamine antiporter